MTNYANPYTQAFMILDTVRTKGYAEAIKSVVKKGDVVMDLGSGSGLLSLFAAAAGAKKVYAFERTDAVKFIKNAIIENKFERIIEIVNVDILTFNFNLIPDKPRVIVSETIGNLPQNEGIHDLFLKVLSVYSHDVVLVPNSYHLIFSVAHSHILNNIEQGLTQTEGVNLSSLYTDIKSRAFYGKVYNEELLSEEYRGEKVSLYHPFPKQHSCLIKIKKTGVVTSLIAGFELNLTTGINITTAVNAPTTSWRQALFPLSKPLECKAGDVLRISLYIDDALNDEKLWSWQVEKAD